MEINNFSFLPFAVLAHFDIFPFGWLGRWMGDWLGDCVGCKIENKVHFSRADLCFNLR